MTATPALAMLLVVFGLRALAAVVAVPALCGQFRADRLERTRPLPSAAREGLLRA